MHCRHRPSRFSWEHVNTETLIALDQRRLWHPFTQLKAWSAPDHEPLVLVDGKGAWLQDSRGRRYLDGNSSIWTNIHGHRHPRITEAIKVQLDRVAHVSFLGSTNAPAIELAEKLIGLFPKDTFSRVFYSDDGSTAIEVALKMSLQYWQLAGQPQRKRFVAFTNAYHGDTAGASSLGGVAVFAERFAAMHFPVRHVADAAELAELDPSDIAAVIIEPLVQGAAGIRLWPPGMLRALRAWCDTHGVHLIFDEVLTGFGRTGRLFAGQHEEAYPDFLCLAKGLTGGFLPLAATLTTERIYEAFLGEYHERKTFFYGHSYCGNPVGCAAALASLAVFEEEKTLDALPAKIGRLRELLAGLAEECSAVADVRQCGLIAGIEIRRPGGEAYPWEEQTGARVCVAARPHGLLTRPILDTVVLMPPLCTTEAELELAVRALQLATAEICR
jgi:adenosylmethionine-8-amino-7-oxononanoate aminotransferase